MAEPHHEQPSALGGAAYRGGMANARASYAPRAAVGGPDLMFPSACLTFELANKTFQNNGDPVRTAKLIAHIEFGYM